MTTLEFSLKDTVRPQLKKLARKAENPLPGLDIAARAVANLLKAHYRNRDLEGNKMGGDRTGFWASVGRAVNAPQAVGKDTVRVSISHPAILQKIHGGVIRAKKAGALTIPVHPLAYGRRASVLNQKLKFTPAGKSTAILPLFRPKGKDYLAAEDASGKLTVYYILKKSITQKPDPKALPPNGEMQRTADEKFTEWLNR
jgi:hypothetical protein